MDVKTMTEAVKIIAGKCETEASGGISRDQLMKSQEQVSLIFGQEHLPILQKI